MNLLPNSSYFKNILTLLSGSFLSQVIQVLGLLILARYYHPEHFGVFAVFSAIVLILGMLANGRFEFAILLPKEGRQSVALTHLCISFAFVFALVILLIISIPNLWENLLGEELNAIKYAIPLAILLQGFIQALNAVANRNQQYPLMSKAKIINALITVVTSIYFGIEDHLFEGLIYGRILGQFMEVVFLSFSLNIFADLIGVSVKESIQSGKRYVNFLKFSTIEALLNTFFKQIPVFALSMFSGQSMTGLFNMSKIVVERPLGMVVASTSKVYYQNIINLVNEGKSVEKFFLKNLKALALIVVPASLLAIFLAPILFPLLLGDEWSYSATFTIWLLPYLGVNFIKSPLSSIIDVKNKIRENLVFEIGFVLISIVAMYVGLKVWDNPLLAVQLFSIGNATMGLIQLRWFYSLTK